MKAKYLIVLSKTVVGVDRPMKEQSKHIQKAILVKHFLSSHGCHFVIMQFFTKLPHVCVQCVYFVKRYQIAESKAVVRFDWPMKELSMHIQKRH